MSLFDEKYANDKLKAVCFS